MKVFRPKVWEKEIEKALRPNMLTPMFIPKYKGKIKLLKWICHKFKIGKYQDFRYMNNIKGTRIRIKSLNELE